MVHDQHYSVHNNLQIPTITEVAIRQFIQIISYQTYLKPEPTNFPNVIKCHILDNPTRRLKRWPKNALIKIIIKKFKRRKTISQQY